MSQLVKTQLAFRQRCKLFCEVRKKILEIGITATEKPEGQLQGSVSRHLCGVTKSTSLLTQLTYAGEERFLYTRRWSRL